MTQINLQETKDTLLQDVAEDRKENLEKVLNQALKNLNIEDKDIPMDNLVMPLIKGVMTKTLGHEFVGVQPVDNGSVEKITAKRTDETLELETKTEIHDYSLRWTTELENDLSKFMPNKDSIDYEILKALTTEITAESTIRIFDYINGIVASDACTNKRKINKPTPDQLIETIIDLGKEIGAKINQDTANWVVVSPSTYTLMSASDNIKREVTDGYDNMVGTLSDGAIKVYVDSFKTNHNVLMGYKGDNQNAGAFYCPNNVAIPGDRVIDPETSELLMKFKAQDAFVSDDHSVDYYGEIVVERLDEAVDETYH